MSKPEGVFYSYSRKHRDKKWPRSVPSGILAQDPERNAISLTDLFKQPKPLVVFGTLAEDSEFKLPIHFIVAESGCIVITRK